MYTKTPCIPENKLFKEKNYKSSRSPARASKKLTLIAERATQNRRCNSHIKGLLTVSMKSLIHICDFLYMVDDFSICTKATSKEEKEVHVI
jgi:hypothetical protein